MAQLFRSVNYYNLPRFMCIHLYMTHLFQKCGIPSQIDQIGLPESSRLSRPNAINRPQHDHGGTSTIPKLVHLLLGLPH